jgi:hypothetical protein
MSIRCQWFPPMRLLRRFPVLMECCYLRTCKSPGEARMSDGQGYTKSHRTWKIPNTLLVPIIWNIIIKPESSSRPWYRRVTGMFSVVGSGISAAVGEGGAWRACSSMEGPAIFKPYSAKGYGGRGREKRKCVLGRERALCRDL